jgi:thioredoxin reductase (NADPH)
VEYEVVSIGSGLAATTAALFSARLGRRTASLGDGLPGGQLLSVTRIDDYPGFPSGVAGFELGPALQEQAMSAGVELRATPVTGLHPNGDGWEVVTGGDTVRTQSVIVATGSEPRPLDVPGAERLHGRGISHCASCDGPIHVGATVVVIGGGDSALQEALELAGFAARVIVVCRDDALSGQAVYRSGVDASDVIEVRLRSVVEEIHGDERVTGVRVRGVDSSDVDEIDAAGVFPYVGTVGRTGFLAGVIEPDASGRLMTDALMRTSARGVCAAGDVRTESVAQAIAAAGDGATAAFTLDRFLRDGAWVVEA